MKIQTFAVDGPLAPVFAGWHAGHYSLPDRLIAAGRAYGPLLEAAREAARIAREEAPLGWQDALEIEYAGRLATRAAETGTADLDPLVAAFLERAREIEALAARRAIAERAAEKFGGSALIGAFTASAPELVRDHLVPALDAVLTDVRAVAPALRDFDVDEPASVVGNQAASGAYLALQGLAARYRAIRAVQALLRAYVATTPGEQDSTGLFFDTRSDPARTASHYTARGLAPAGPSLPLARLLWLGTDPQAEPWLPLPAEQDERFRELLAAIANRHRATSAA